MDHRWTWKGYKKVRFVVKYRSFHNLFCVCCDPCCFSGLCSTVSEGSPVLPCTIPCHPWMTENVELIWYPWTIHGYQYILVYPLVRVSVDAIVTVVSLDHPWLPVYTGLPPCQSIRGLLSYSGIPGPSMVTSIYWSTPLSEYPWIT